MKKYLIVVFNLIIIVALFVSVSLIKSIDNEKYLEIQKDLFASNTDNIQHALSDYFIEEQDIVNSWASYINQSSLSMDEAFEYLKKSTTDESYAVHILWKDTYTGYTTKCANGKDGIYDVDYSVSGSSSANAFSIIKSIEIQKDKINMLPAFSDVVTGYRVVGFCQYVTLFDGGESKDAIIVRLLRVDYLTDRWTLASNYSKSYSAIIELSGYYILRPIQMKGNSFFEYVFSYNMDTYSSDDVEKLMHEHKSGSFIALDKDSKKTFYSWAVVEDGNDNIIVVNAIAIGDFSKDVDEFNAVYIIGIVLLLLLLVNIGYFYLGQTKEKKLRQILEQQLLTISKQEAMLKDALAAAQHANNAKTVFLNSMSHDIRTPMNAIIGFTSLCAAHSDNPDIVKDYLKKIQTSSNHLLSLINEVLDMSRIESGHVKIEEKEVHLPDVVHDLRTIILSTISSKQQELFIDTIDVVHENIFADRLRLNQVLLNLLSNAMKFTPTGGIISLRIFEKPSNNSEQAVFEFHVKDNGIGMSKEFQEHIFEAFTREESATTNGIQGSGLGMAIVKNIVSMMNGTIEVESEQGKGTEFVVTLPFKLASGNKEVIEVEELKGLRALVADDNSDTAISVSNMLINIGMRADWTLSGKEAVLRTKVAFENNDEYSAYIIDWLMPDMNGIETVRRIRKIIGDSKPIIILTAYDWSDVEAEAREAGVTRFCSKPLFMSELRDALLSAGEKITSTKEKVYNFKGKKVLLVEDNEFNQEIALEFLKHQELDVEVANDGSIAVEIMKSERACTFDLILMDIQMPIMDGYSATRAIRSIDNEYVRNIPIIAMTANAFEEDKKMAIEAGMNGHITKPINVDKLYETIDDIINKK